jgi:hypothetical protein
MEQKDYILREIEKIRLIIAAIRQITLGRQGEFGYNARKAR